MVIVTQGSVGAFAGYNYERQLRSKGDILSKLWHTQSQKVNNSTIILSKSQSALKRLYYSLHVDDIDKVHKVFSFLLTPDTFQSMHYL